MRGSDDMHIEVTTTSALQDPDFISQGIQSFNRRTVPGIPEVSEDLNFAVFARSADGSVAGGIRAKAFWGCLCIELLWIDAHARGHGLGARRVKSAEAFALEHGFRRSRVETTSFQARPFYEKPGYEIYGVLDDFPEGHVSCYLKKNLRD
jgi:GNAT superfamily N-acetyltransferase